MITAASRHVSFRVLFAIGLLLCAGMLAYALYAQHGLGLEPCPLCVLQRIAVLGLALVFALGLLHGPPGRGGRMAYAGLAVLVAGTGAAVAGRHVWLQSLPPDQVPACGPGLDYMLEAFPLQEVLRRVFSGSGECAEVDWTYWGLSMPAWTLVAFVGLALLAVAAAVVRR